MRVGYLKTVRYSATKLLSLPLAGTCHHEAPEVLNVEVAVKSNSTSVPPAAKFERNFRIDANHHSVYCSGLPWAHRLVALISVLIGGFTMPVAYIDLPSG